MTARRSNPRAKSTRNPKPRASRRPQRRAARREDAIAMLRADHARVEEMFDRFENVRGAERKEKLVEEICRELEVHTTLEEEIFYPAVREAIDDDDLMDEATVEHQSAKELIAQLRSMGADDDLYDAKVTVLSEYIKHHVKEEHQEMFPQARSSGVDLMELAEQMRARKEELTTGTIEKVKRMLR
jgi:hemerythrin-like domain-containing protein